ncbi:MAG TPA: DUF2071 domain-containing protein [Polyangiaceae bacterium]|nr:DUF2071 domain-containing protein [Polyangiaceae bacterium]
MTDWEAILREQEHRPYPLPSAPFAITMSWHDLLFVHFEVEVSALRAAVPRGLELDLWQGQAWVGVVPFYMSQVGPRALNQLPWVSRFEELNVRTYVTHQGRGGVFFFSLDAANWLAVLAARAQFHLPYFWASMQLEHDGPTIRYRSRRRLGPSARFEGSYQPSGAPYRSEPGSLEHWLTERYCLYTTDGAGRVCRGEIHHLPWPLQAAEAEIISNEMGRPHGLSLAAERPLLHFARRLDVLAWPLERTHRAPA